MKIAVIGLWHQGAVAAACLADAGCEVVGADADGSRIRALKSGRAPLFEPGLDELIARGAEAGRLRFTDDLAAAVRGVRDILLAFDTPVNDRDESDLTEIFAAIRAMAPALEDDVVLLVTAQVPVGTCDEIGGLIRSLRPGLAFGVAYLPENLRLGQAIERFRNPALPVIGADDVRALDRAVAMLAPLGARWERVGLRTAEMTKHALNGFLATCVTFANELGNVCDEVGADGHRLAEVLRLEPRVGAKAPLAPGLGFSGGTLARDVQTLRGLGDRAGLDTPMLDGLWASNQIQNRSVVHRLRRMLGGELKNRRICVLGLTYKPDTSTLRRSAALEVIGELHREGASVTGTDPRADVEELKACGGFTFFENPYDAMSGADAMILMTPWKQYRDLDVDEARRRVRGAVALDTANLWPHDEWRRRGFRIAGIGRGKVAT